MSLNELNATLMPHSIIHGDACFAYFNKIRGIPRVYYYLDLLWRGHCSPFANVLVKPALGELYARANRP